MIHNLIDSVKDPFQDYYYSLKEVVSTQGITLSFKVKMNALLGLSSLNVNPESTASDHRSWIRDGADVIEPMFYLASYFVEQEKDRINNTFRGRFPIFLDEEVQLKVAVDEKFTKGVEFTLNYKTRDSSPFQPLLPFFTGQEQTLYVFIKFNKFSDTRKLYEEKTFLDNKTLRWLLDESKIKFLNDYSYNLTKEEYEVVSQELNSLLSPNIPFNDVIKTQLLLKFLDQYRDFDEVQFEVAMRHLKEKEFLLGYEEISDRLSSFTDKFERGETINFARPIFVPYPSF